MRVKFTLSVACAALLLSCFVSPATAQSKVNFSGTWKMNAEKSKFGRGGPDAITSKIEHKESAFSETLTISTPNGERTIETKYVTDGKESEQEVRGQSAKTLAKWEGDALTIDWNSDGNRFVRKLSLSPDGKTLTMVVKQTGQDGQEVEDTVVFNKQ